MDPFTIVALISTLLSVSTYVVDRTLSATSDKNRQEIYKVAAELQNRADTTSFEYQNLVNKLANLFYEAKDYANRAVELKHLHKKTQEAIDKRKEMQEQQKEATVVQAAGTSSYITGKDVESLNKAIQNRLGGSING